MTANKPWEKLKTNLNITSRDLNELDDPLDNILLDVMFESFYQRVANLKSAQPIPHKGFHPEDSTSG